SPVSKILIIDNHAIGSFRIWTAQSWYSVSFRKLRETQCPCRKIGYPNIEILVARPLGEFGQPRDFVDRPCRLFVVYALYAIGRIAFRIAGSETKFNPGIRSDRIFVIPWSPWYFSKILI